MKSKKGFSQVVSVSIIILITVAAAVIVGNSTKNLVNNKLDKSKSCFDLLEKVKINDENTCYNLVNDTVQVSVIREDVELESITIVIFTNITSFKFKLTEEERVIPLIQKYNPYNETGVQMPSKEGSKTYIVDGFLERPERIEVAPETEETLCDSTDTLQNLPVC